jgi:hypothetical protein
MADRWTNSCRIDGLKLMQGPDGAWIIMPRSEGLPVAECPCCNKPFATQKAARLCAEVLFPILGDAA